MKPVKLVLNYVIIYANYILFVVIYEGVRKATLTQTVVAPIMITLIGYLAIILMVDVYRRVNNKKIIFYIDLAIIIGVFVTIFILFFSSANYNYKNDLYSGLFALGVLITCSLIIPFIIKKVFKFSYTLIHYVLVWYSVALSIGIIFGYIMFELSYYYDLYCIIVIITLPVFYYLLNKIQYNEQEIIKYLLDKRFLNFIIVVSLAVAFIYGIHIISNATDIVHERVFSKVNVIDSQLLKDYVLEERIKGIILTCFGGIGLLIKYFFANKNYYQAIGDK